MKITTMVGEKFGTGFGTINAGENTRMRAESLAAAAGNHLVKVDKTAPSACIDGRGCRECLDALPTEPRPSVAGGAGTTSFAAAELTGWFQNENDRDLSGRFGTVLDTLRAGGITPGNHCDRGSYDTGFVDPDSGAAKTGCGANDKLPAIIDTLQTNADTVDSLVRSLQTDPYTADVRLTPASEVAARISDWNPAESMRVTAAQNSDHTIEILESTHAEILVVFNYVRGHTVDRDALLTATGKQVFVVDLWYLDDLAHALSAGRKNENDWYQKLHYAMTAYQVATYLTLCDGSQRPAMIRADSLAA